jgi:hypothetical protein
MYQPTTLNRFEENKLAEINIYNNRNEYRLHFKSQQSSLGFKMSNQKEDYLAEFNPQFNLFAIDNIDFENFPPVENKYGGNS